MESNDFYIGIVCPVITKKTISDQAFFRIDSTTAVMEVVVENSDIYEAESEGCPASDFRLYDELGNQYTEFPDNIEFDSTDGSLSIDKTTLMDETTVSIRWTDFENVEWSSDPFTLEVVCPTLTVLTADDTKYMQGFSENRPEIEATTMELIYSADNMYTVEDEGCPRTEFTIWDMDENDGAGAVMDPVPSYFEIDADTGDFSVDKMSLFEHTIKIVWTYHNGEEYESPEVTIEIKCPDLTVLTLTDMEEYRVETTNVITILPADLYTVDEGCPRTEFELMDADTDTALASSDNNDLITFDAATGELSFDQAVLLDAVYVYIKWQYFDETEW